jgi:hypothetical protein
VFLVLPYFMESAVLQSFPALKMMDLKVNYVNHRKMRAGKWLTSF